MSRRFLLPILAVAGVAIAVLAVVRENRPVPRPRPAVQLPTAPFPFSVAATGTIEPSSGNVALGTPVPGIIKTIFVKWGDRVKAGDRLLRIDDGDLRAELPPLMAGKKESAARLEQARGQLRNAQSVTDRRAISLEELENRRYAVAIASAALEVAEARIGQLQAEMERRTVRSPIAGRVLRIATHPGEYAPSGASASPLMVLGSDRELHVRVDVDEYDAWRVRSGAPAVASIRGNPGLRASLHFIRIEPYLVPKTSLSGSSTERVDTRVLQVIYAFDPSLLPNAYVGQQLDVFIEAAAPVTGAAQPKAGAP